MKYEVCQEKWHELSREDKIRCFNDFAREYRPDEEIWAEYIDE